MYQVARFAPPKVQTPFEVIGGIAERVPLAATDQNQKRQRYGLETNTHTNRSNTESVSSKSDDATSQVAEAEDEEAAEAEEESESDEEEEEEEEEEEAEDQKPAIVAECEATKACAPYKHHFDECQERVLSKSDDDSHHEDWYVLQPLTIFILVEVCTDKSDAKTASRRCSTSCTASTLAWHRSSLLSSSEQCKVRRM